MRLIFDCTELSYMYDYSGYRAGVFNVALNLYKNLRAKGVEIVFYCDYRRYYFMKQIKEFQEIPLLKEHSVINRFWGKLVYFSYRMPLIFKHAILILSRYYDKYFYLINKKNLQALKGFDIYFSPFTPPSKEIDSAVKLKFRMLHDTIPIIENGMTNSPKCWYYKIYSTINDKDFYVTNSENTRKDILKYFPEVREENIKTTYLGVNESFKQTEKTSEFKYVFSLCTLGKRKNVIFAIKNFFEFIKRYKINDLYLVLAGGVWKKFERELYQTIGEFDKSKIILKGYVKDEELPELYSNALMFIYPSLYEGFGLPVLEAMKCGCPVITSNTSSLPEVIGDAGIQINPENDEELIGAYHKMYFDTFYRELCAERGLIRAKKFSWQNCASELLEFLKEKDV